MGEIESMHGKNGSFASPGSIKRNRSRALCVGILLCLIPPGIHMPDVGGAIHQLVSTLHVTAPRSANINYPLQCLCHGISLMYSLTSRSKAIAGFLDLSGSKPNNSLQGDIVNPNFLEIKEFKFAT
jgi:hypothetical protein